MGKDERKATDDSKAAPAMDPKIPFDEFAQTAGLDRVLLAGFKAYWTGKRETTHRTHAEWMAAYQAFGTMPA